MSTLRCFVGISSLYPEHFELDDVKPAPRRNLKKFIFVGVILILLISIASWTAFSPQILSVQDSSQISSSLFQFGKVKQLVNFTDGEGSYTFLFGMDYNDSASPGVPTIVQVFASLVNQGTSSGFLRGVGLQVSQYTVLIDGVEDEGISSRSTNNGAILESRLSQIEINQTGGTHVLSVRMIVSTVDVNYIGYLPGVEELVSLNGTISILLVRDTRS